jgi:hypothetical protein
MSQMELSCSLSYTENILENYDENNLIKEEKILLYSINIGNTFHNSIIVLDSSFCNKIEL